MKKFYFINDGVDYTGIYLEAPICITETEIMRLSAEWERNLMECFHEASGQEIEEHGYYDDNVNYYITDENGDYRGGFATYQEAKAFAMELVAVDEENVEYIDNPGQYKIMNDNGASLEKLP